MQGLPQQQQSDGLTERERQQQRQQQMQQAAATRQAAPVAPVAQPKRITNNYMGPPEAPVQAEEPARAGPTGFVGFSQQLAANQDVAQRMAYDAGRNALEGGGVGNLRNDAGRQALLQRAYGKAAQVTDFDAALTGGAGGNYFQQLESQYGADAMARQKANREAIDQQLLVRRSRAAEEAARLQRTRATEAEKKIQDEVERLRRRSEGMARSSTGNQVKGVTPEQWAAMHGMTLEQWVRGGKKPAY